MSTESTSHDPAAANTSTAGPPARIKLGSKKFALWILLAIFQLGLIFACIKLWIQTRSNSDSPHPTLAEPPATLPPRASERPKDAHRPAVDFRTVVARGDSLISEERYEPALEHFRQLIGQTDRYRESLILYRAGLCSEQIGRSADALEYYQQAGRLYPQSIVLDACQLGQARVLVRTEKWQEARTLLWDLSLRSGDPHLGKRALFADASYLLGHVLALEAMPAQPQPGLMTARQSRIFVDWSIRHCASWVAPDANTDNRTQDSNEQQVTVRRTGKSPEDLLCSITAHEVLVDDLLHRLCAEAGIKATWSDRARQQAQARRSTIVVTNMPLKRILSVATDFIGLVWSLRANELSLTVDAEISGDELAKYRRALAQQTLREAILAFPVHALTPNAYLDLGNLEFAAKKFAEACPWYERLLQEAARSPAKLEALYNLGLARRAMNQPTSARQAFYRVVDQQRGHELAALAYLQIGYAHLEDAEHEEAFRPLRRSVSLGNGTPVQPLATLALAAGYLLAKNPRAARTALGDARASLVDSRFRAMAIFLDSLACYRSVPPENPNKREATELLRSLWAVRQSDLLGSVGWLLMGQAYQELGLEDRMATLYQEVLPRVRGPVAFQMTRAVADFFVAGDDPLRAQPLFESLVEAGDPRWSPEACLRLAELALLQNRPRECLKWAERLSGDRSAKYYPKLLRLAGQAYEKLGDLDAAAKCFSGRWPEPEADR